MLDPLAAARVINFDQIISEIDKWALEKYLNEKISSVTKVKYQKQKTNEKLIDVLN